MADHKVLLDTVNAAFDEAYEIINSEDNWKEVKRNQHGDVVVTRKNKHGKSIYRVKAVIEAAPEKLINALSDIPKTTNWNHTLTKCEVVAELSEEVQVTYQITSGGGGNMVSPRDFILLVKKGYKGDDYFQAGCSIDYPSIPKDKNIVRAWNGPGGQMIRPIPGEPDKCELYWLLDCEYNGWILSSILAVAMPFAQIQFVECVRELAKTI